MKTLQTTVVHGMAYCEAHNAYTVTTYTHTVVLHGEPTVVCDTCKAILRGLQELSHAVLNGANV